VRLFVQRLAAVGPHRRHGRDVRSEVVEALGPEEEPLRHLGHPRQSQGLSQSRPLRERRVVMIAVSAFRVEAAALRDSLQESGLPRPVLAHEERHRGPERQFDPSRERRNVEGMPRRLPLVVEALDRAEERRSLAERADGNPAGRHGTPASRRRPNAPVASSMGK
jgi:hypothetical protein